MYFSNVTDEPNVKLCLIFFQDCVLTLFWKELVEIFQIFGMQFWKNVR